MSTPIDHSYPPNRQSELSGGRRASQHLHTSCSSAWCRTRASRKGLKQSASLVQAKSSSAKQSSTLSSTQTSSRITSMARTPSSRDTMSSSSLPRYPPRYCQCTVVVPLPLSLQPARCQYVSVWGSQLGCCACQPVRCVSVLHHALQLFWLCSLCRLRR